MKKKLIILGLLLCSFTSFSQVSISTDGSLPDNSAILDVKSNTRGLLLPRLSNAQRDAIPDPAAGLIIFNTTTSQINICTGSAWFVPNGTTVPLWTCGNPITDVRDGRIYATVQIGTQCWFAQNINIGIMKYDWDQSTNNGIFEKFCQGMDTNYCNIYGGFYQWDEMMQYITTEGAQGICPQGWHVPSSGEWNTLTSYIGGSYYGGKLKETGTDHWSSPNTGATNETGFTALAGGWHGPIGWSYNMYMAVFWTSTQPSEWEGTTRSLEFNTTWLSTGMAVRSNAQNVRCVKN